ncbi:ATP/GTP-binding protein [Streptomyces sp. CB01201]|nr:ATP/GTP-binding protein [Streptomyces sp. CB01201]
MVTGPRQEAGDSPGPQGGKDTRTGHALTTPDNNGPEGAAWPVTTWQGWRHFAATPPPQPPAPGQPLRSTEERLAYHSAFVTVRTPFIDTLTNSVRTLMILGQHQQTTARPSLIVTGPAAAGKTTALLHTGRACHLAHTRQHPPHGHSAHPQVPVAYVLVPPAASAKTLATEFARYLAIPVTTRMTQAQITDAVCHTYNQIGVRLILIDEIHRLNPRTTTGAETADLLKDLTERIRATFVYAGIDVTTTALFSGARGAQLAGRASLVECGAFPARLGKREPFRELITGLEAAFDLQAHRPGTLPRLAPHLHQRTAGRIGSLTRLIRQAAITDGTERITKTSLDAIRLDHQAEQHHRPTPTRPPPHR